MRALLVGAAPADDAWRLATLAGCCEAVFAVDGGADACVAAGLTPDVVVGDMDSISPSVLADCEAAGAEIVRHPSSKDSTDLDLALDLVRARGFHRAVLTQVVGGRADHELSVLGTVARAADLWVVVDEASVRGWALGRRGRRSLELEGAGATVSVFSLGRHARARSSGLRWPLDSVRIDAFSTHGQSNVIESEPARIEWRSGRLLVLSPRVDDVAPAREV